MSFWLSGGGGFAASLCSHPKLTQQVAQRLSSCRGESPICVSKTVLLHENNGNSTPSDVVKRQDNWAFVPPRLCAPSLRSQWRPWLMTLRPWFPSWVKCSGRCTARFPRCQPWISHGRYALKKKKKKKIEEERNVYTLNAQCVLWCSTSIVNCAVTEFSSICQFLHFTFFTFYSFYNKLNSSECDYKGERDYK